MQYSRAFCEGMKAAGQERVVNLVQYWWANSQKYGALLWSGRQALAGSLSEANERQDSRGYSCDSSNRVPPAPCSDYTETMSPTSTARHRRRQPLPLGRAERSLELWR
ncbi:hypothetical protein F5Y19DRAFT_481486 [Xylariaceae sp. FL1651]|nr:hypothetical protein F5Y19DRAFT_481486 [Xylariaceae sp. FL1651]